MQTNTAKKDTQSNSNARLQRGIKNERIYRILLNNIEKPLTQYRIAKLAEAHQIQVSLLLRKLQKQGVADGARVTNPKGLLTLWSQSKSRYLHQSYMLPRIMEVLKTTELEYGLTTYQAESMINRYLFMSRTEFYIRSEDFDAWHSLMVEEGALVGGGNVRIRWYDDQVFYNSFSTEGYQLVSIPQLMVDLLREGGSAAEAAEQMMSKYTDLMRLNRLHAIRSSGDPPQ